MSCQFEFNSEMLLFLAEHLYSCKYGTFFYNSEIERLSKRLRTETVSIWLEINLRRDTDFKNPYFNPIQQLTTITRIPVTCFYKLRVWKEYFFRFTESAREPAYYFMEQREQLDIRASQLSELNFKLKQLKQRTIVQLQAIQL